MLNARRQDHSSPVYLVTIMAISLVGIGILASVAVHSTPIADDYGWLTEITGPSPLVFLHFYWIAATDRYSNALLLMLTVKVFGGGAVQITPLLLFALLWLFSAIAVRSIGARADAGPWDTGAGRAVLGCLAALEIIVTAPSLFDTFGWYNAVTIYLAGVVATSGLVAWMAYLATSVRVVRPRDVVLSFVIGMIVAGFTEVVGLVVVAGASLAAVNAFAAAQPGRRRRSLAIAYLATAFGAAVGVAVVFMGPGTRLRARMQAARLALGNLEHALINNLWYLHNAVGWRALPAVAAGLLCWQLRGPVTGGRTARWLLIWAVFLIFAPLLIVAAATGYAGSQLAPYRTVFVATALAAAGVAVLAYLVVSAVVIVRPMLSRAVLPVASVTLSIGIGVFVVSALPVIRAEQLRATLVDARAISVRRQLQRHPSEVLITPAPMIDQHTQAYDLLFGDARQIDYVIDGIHQYYGIPAAVQLRIARAQPHEYCLPEVSVPWFGVRSCGQLAQAGSAGRRIRPSRGFGAAGADS